MSEELLRILVVDDSPQSRQAILRAIEASGIARVVGTAATGTEAIKATRMLKPDALTLDLEMPKMDGFSFLRLLMASQPMPVLVISGNDRKENVFRALELGAIDFVSKPERAEAADFGRLLLSKIGLLRAARQPAPAPKLRPLVSIPPRTPRLRRPRFVVAIGASTGGPTAISEVLSQLAASPDYAVVIAQHMPPRFTTTFAQRLDRYTPLRVFEATDRQCLYAGDVLVCPGNTCMELTQGDEEHLVVRLVSPYPEERYVPSVSRLLRSVAATMRERAVGVVLTGMGDDGAEGAADIARHGGSVLVESEQSAVVYGMPREVVRRVSGARRVHLLDMARTITQVVSSR